MVNEQVGKRVGAVVAFVVFLAGTASNAHAVAGVCNGALNILVTQGAFLAPGDQATIQIDLGSGPINGGAANTIRLDRVRYDLDCDADNALGIPCTDQGDIMNYLGDATILSSGTVCGALTWTSNVPGGGSATNEIVFTPSSPITFAANTPADGSACALTFKVKLDNLEATSGATADSTPTQVEVVAGFSTVLPADTTCDNGGHSGVSQTGFIDICPTCTGDACTTSVCNTTTGQCDTTPLTSTPCADSDGNACTTAGCEVNPADATHGICVQTHQQQTCTGDACTSSVCNTTTGLCDTTPLTSTPCADTDGNACTTAGCEPAPGNPVVGVCVQTHQTQTCTGDACTSSVCNATTGQCDTTPLTSTPCADTDGNACTTAGCEPAPGNPSVGVCVQTHAQQTCTGDACTTSVCNTTTGLCDTTPLTSTPCADTDGNACTTAGCEVNPADTTHGICVQTHGQQTCTGDACTSSVCNTTTGQCDTTPLTSTPCADTDGNGCTTAGCEVNPADTTHGICVQTHQGQTCTSDSCTNSVCNTTTGQCDSTPLTSTPCADTDNNLCTTAGCEADPINPAHGICVQTHMMLTCPGGSNPCEGQQCNPMTGMCEATGGAGSSGIPFLVRTHGKLGNGSQLLAGFGANDVGGVIQLGNNAFAADGTTVAGDTVNLLSNTSVFNVLANHLHQGPGSIVRGTVGTPVLPLTNPFCPIPAFTCTGGVDQVIPKLATVTLAPGTYGNIRVKDGATLILAPEGVYNICSFATGRNVTIEVSGMTPTMINVVGNFRLADAGTFLPLGTTPTPFLNIGGDSLRIGRRSTIQAFISAPNAHAAFGRGAKITGSFCVLSNQADKGVTIMCPMPAPTPGQTR